MMMTTIMRGTQGGGAGAAAEAGLPLVLQEGH